MLCGAGCAGAHDESWRLADALNAPIVHALRGKEHVEYDNPVRCRHDRPDRLRLGLPGDEAVRHAADARHRFSLPPVLSEQAPRSRRSISGREPRQWRCRLDLGAGRRRERHDRGAAAAAHRPRTNRIASRRERCAITKRRAQASTSWQTARRAKADPSAISCRASSANWQRTTRSSPAMSARRRSGRRAICT